MNRHISTTVQLASRDHDLYVLEIEKKKMRHETNMR
jgi:hypothetical protein